MELHTRPGAVRSIEELADGKVRIQIRDKVDTQSRVGAGGVGPQVYTVDVEAPADTPFVPGEPIHIIVVRGEVPTEVL